MKFIIWFSRNSSLVTIFCFIYLFSMHVGNYILAGLLIFNHFSKCSDSSRKMDHFKEVVLRGEGETCSFFGIFQFLTEEISICNNSCKLCIFNKNWFPKTVQILTYMISEFLKKMSKDWHIHFFDITNVVNIYFLNYRYYGWAAKPQHRKVFCTNLSHLSIE